MTYRLKNTIQTLQILRVQLIRMLKSQFAISLAALLLVSPDGTQARFLQSSTNQLSNIEAFSPQLSQATTITYNANLLCGECILGGFVYCTNGIEGYTGKTAQPGTCCPDSKNCTQVTTKGWVCSSKYDNMTIPDKLRVCPYDNQQCGDQNLTFTDLGDSQCLRLKSLKKGNACLYKVKSKCGVPTFQLNDTSANVFTSSVMISNKTITSSVASTDKCNSVQSQDCICKEISANGTTKYVCDCQTAFNKEIQTKDCPTCKKLTDALGNVIQQCKCNLPVPVQTIEDQQCQCARLTNATTKATYLSCTCAPSTVALSLPENQCKCINNYNATAKKAYLDCTCKNLNQCSDPATRIPAPPKAQVAPCSTSYPCSCNALPSNATQNATGNSTASSTKYQCTCQNPSTGLRTLIPSVSANQCSCKININSNSTSWIQECNCCLPEELVRIELIPPVKCGTNDLKEPCSCINATVTGSTAYRQTCNCTHPQSNVVAPNLIFNNNGCDCENNAIGKKACSCCVPWEVLSTQLQPKCNQTLDTCRCLSASLKSIFLSQSDSKLACECDSAKLNKTFIQVAPSNQSCYCAPLAANQTQRACNCCLSDDLLKTLKCSVGKNSNQCKCDVSSNPFTNICDCPNKLGYASNQISSKIPISKDQCQCNNSTGITTCNCCTSNADIQQAPSTCTGQDVSQKCTKCTNVTVDAKKKITAIQCTCVGTHPADNSVIVTAPNTNVDLTKCNCNSQAATCNCCGNSAIFASQKPTCTADQTAEKPQCLLKNVTETFTRSVNYQVNQTTSVVCRRTGYNGELCQKDANMSFTAWSNSYACYTSAKAVCEFSLTTLTCGWVQSDALKTCLAKPAAINAPAKYQNITFTPNPAVTYTTTANKTRNEVYQVTSTKFQCNFTSARYPGSPFTLINIDQAQCACAAPAVPAKSPKGTIATSACECCIKKDALDAFLLSNYTCKTSGTAPTDCNCIKSTGICQCNAPDGVSQYKDIKVDTKNSCACANTGDKSQCKCCLSTNINALIPGAPICQYNTAATTKCDCNPVNGTSVSKCSCPNNLVQTLPNKNCNCLNTVNGAIKTSTCNCCTVTKPLTCPNTTYADTQDCDCKNVTIPAIKTTAASWQYNCTCLRKDNKAIGDLQFTDNNACGINISTGANQCCITPAQFATELPVLKCQIADKNQSCGCTNLTGNSSTRNCACTRDDNGVLGNFKFPDSSCLCSGPRVNSNLQNCNCCVSKSQQSLQIPTKNCDVEGPGFAPQVCTCKNSTTSSLSCTCSRSEFLVQKTFNISSSYCLYQDNGNQFECCLNQEQRTQLIPSLQCAATDVSQTGCSCTNVTNNGMIDYTCSCPFIYQKTKYVASTLTTKQNGCMCNGTTCGCCLSASLIEYSTQKVCTSNQTRSVCQSCLLVVDTKAKKNTLTCSSCDTYPTESASIFIRGQSFTGLEETSCQCRNDTARTNCTCCQATAVVPLQPAAPTCSIGTNLISNTVCNVASGNDTVIRCNLTRIDGFTETYYRNVLQSDLASINCLAVANGTRIYQQCKSCAYQIKLAPPAPDCSSLTEASVEQCQCLAVKASNGSARYNCDCNYKNVHTVKDLSLSTNLCGCLETNTLGKPCGCCVTNMQFRSAPNPACGNETQAICSATLTTVTDAKTKVTTKTLTGDCMAFVNNATVVNKNMTLDQNKCACFNDTNNTLSCKCCMSGNQDIKRLPNKVCKADQVGGQCDCLGTNANNTCSCTLNNGNYSFKFPNLTPNSSDCSCVTSTKGNNTDRSCSCCAPRTLITPNITTCAANSTTQQCNCKNPVFGISTCDCSRLNGKVLETRNGVALNATSQCACVNQVFNGTTSQNCTCCVPPPPPTFCQSLALPGQSLQGCACKDQVVNGKAVFTCNCSQKIANITASRSNLLYDEASQCCCNEVVNATSKVGTKMCNCTIPVARQEQACSCKVGPQSGSLSCMCSDCFNQQSALNLGNNACQCSSTPLAATNATNATSANCTCTVAQAGLCPSIDITQIPSVTEDTCRASNNDLLPTLPSTSCTNEYEYIVAVVAANKDSSILVEGQSLQFTKQLKGSSSFFDGLLSYFYY